jgi:hemolysin III
MGASLKRKADIHMRKRIKLTDRLLPDYTRGEEVMNMVTHIVGGGMGIAALTLCVIFSILHSNPYGLAGSIVYGVSMITLYTMSSVYHGLRPGTAKKVMQVLDHCTIYFLISGTYTVVSLSALRTVSPTLGWGMSIFQWTLTALAVTLTAIDLEKYNVFSMICYIGMGWAILPFMDVARQALTQTGFLLLLFGGISYTVGAVLYGLGSKLRWMHSVFHIFVVLGSLLQFLCILFYGI